MKKLPVTGLLATLAIALGIPAALVGAASLPWHGARPAAPPRIEALARGKGPLTAGAAEVRFDLPADVPIAGFARLSYRSEGTRDPVGARALVLSTGGCRLALVSAELLLVPEALVEAVRARLYDLQLDGLLLAATHTHAGPGGYWEDLAGERIATGRYDPAVRDTIAGAIALAVRRAASAAGPARIAVARGDASALQHNRDGGPTDGRLTVARVEGLGGAPIAEVAIFAAHPTILGGANRRLSGDWVGRFIAEGEHGTRLLFQGAVGDQSVSLDPPGTAITPEAYAAAVSSAVDGLAFGPPDPAPPLGFAQAEVPLPALAPAAAPPLLRRAASNLAWDVLPGQATATAVRLGPLLVIGVPGEPVTEIGGRWREAAGPGAEILALANGYIGYVESAARTERGEGEAGLTYYGPGLADRLEKAVLAAAVAAGKDGAFGASARGPGKR